MIHAIKPATYTVRYSRRMAGKPLLYISSASASLGDALFGYSQGITAAFQVQPSFIHRMYGKSVTLEQIQTGTTGISPLLPGITIACLGITALFAALGSAYVTDYLGRRISIRIGAFIYLIASCIQMFAPNLTTLIVGRCIQGLGAGMLSTAVPVYQCEIAPANTRGTLISIEAFCMNAGYAVSAWSGYAFFMDARHSETAWRGPYGVQALVSLVLAIWTFFLPETPRWLIQNGFKAEGLWTLADLHAAGDVTDEGVNRTYNAIADTVAFEQQAGAAPWSDLFKKYTRRTVIGWTARMFAQLNGITAILHFLPENLARAGFDVPHALLCSGACSILYGLGTLPAILCIDKLGRRRFLLVGSVALAASLTPIGVIELFRERQPQRISGMGSANGVFIGMALYLFFFGATWGPVPWLLSAELFPLRMRAKGMGLTTASDWLFESAVGLWTPSLFEVLHGAYYFLLVGSCLISGLVVWLVYVETGHQSLEEIGGMFGDQVPPPRKLEQEDPVLALQRRRGRGRSTLSMNSEVTAVTSLLARSQVTLHPTPDAQAATSQITLLSTTGNLTAKTAAAKDVA
ncbi:general substrate transporter [Mycena sp. CBHHK59/15]|nr:general substrate transporter [Mycena sp. CBHHK59/15]